ncbi:uncharacterized protein F5147DRAFT_689415 [Suillus discolor]|uniref:Uncharacterized protein n=1 Tax=Suillus discolor TaxID=1912936 RepID=A0A9P7JVF8_9AGAM|nr:uncharacterized protein F5147DRAFT_689415 [Suillus discolor]KAG2110631.1 hypothetical protein F5147DRAFT_689415 [Suillus discolor]
MYSFFFVLASITCWLAKPLSVLQGTRQLPISAYNLPARFKREGIMRGISVIQRRGPPHLHLMSCTNLRRSEADRVVALLGSLVVVTEELHKTPDIFKCTHSYDWSIQAVHTQYLRLAEKIAGETMDVWKRSLPLERLTRAGKF